MKTTPTIYTPNTTRGGEMRYVLYRHNNNTFSITPQGERFIARSVPDACSLDCYCGAFLEEISQRGQELLAQARQITPTESV